MNDVELKKREQYRMEVRALNRPRNGRSRPGLPSLGFSDLLAHRPMRDPREFKKMTPDERHRIRNKRKAARQAARR